MKELLKKLYEFIIKLIESSANVGPIIACLLILIESILPMLPLFVFITIIFLAYGSVIGFFLSWVFTVLGCFLSFSIVRYFIKDKGKKYQNLNKLRNRLNQITLSQLVVIVAIPFTPAFLVNIAAAISNMSLKKFLTAIVIGKISLVAFWGFIGTSLVESLKDPMIMVQIIIMILIAYLLSLLVNKKLNISD